MKPHLLPFTFLLSSAVLAQQPGLTQPHSTTQGFTHKYKTAAPTPGLAEKLGADVAPLPSSRAGGQSLMANGRQLVSQPLRLRVVRDTTTGLPVFIERKPSAKSPGRTNRNARVSATAATYQFLGQVRTLLNIDNPEASFKVMRSEADDLGQTHVRLTQTHKGLPVLGGELVAHLTDGEVTVLNGRYQPVPTTLSTKPALSLSDAGSRALKDVGKEALVRTFGANLFDMKPVEGELCVFTSEKGAALAYQLTVRPNLLERWEYVIDARTGAVLDKYNHTCSLDGPSKATARDLNGVSRTFQTYQHEGGYYLIDASRPMFNAKGSTMPGSPTGAIWTLDARETYGDNEKTYQITSTNNTNWNATAVSAHYNAGIAYDYYRATFNRNALNGNGGTIISVINIVDDKGKGVDNAYWNGKFMSYGNGNVAFKPLAGALDAAGHEMTHGVIQNTANLQYKNQSGALNESFADIFGAMIDRDDWTLGEDIVKTQVYPSGAMRSLSNPNQNGQGTRGYQPKTMAQYNNTTDDNGGVHSNSGISNYAFYLFATNNSVGKDKAEKVYYRALTNYLVRTSQFLDLRLAVIKAAGDLYGATGAEVAAAKAAFDAVGITENTQNPDPGKQPDVPVANGRDLLLLTDTESQNLYSTDVAVTPAKFDKKTATSLLHRPSVTDDGQIAYYVSSDNYIRAVNLTGTPKEEKLTDQAVWDNVTISKDGKKLAALTNEKDASIWVYSYDLKKWKQFKLYNPTYTEGVETGDVQYADSFEWDFSGEYVVYDAYNELTKADGNPLDYWDVGFIHVWDKAANNFADGQIEKLIPSLDEGESIGNPSFSKNSPDIIAFDYFNENDDTYYVLGGDLSKGNLKVMYENNTLGFPSFSRLDNRLVFSTETSGREDVAGINLAADKLSVVGNATVLYTDAKWPVWYTQGQRAVTKTSQTITFDAITDRYTDQGDVTLKATASSGLPVTFTVRSGPAQITGTKLKITGPGTVTIRASQEGNTTFNAATPVDRTFTVLAVLGLEPTLADQLKVYPNPAGSTLTVELPMTAPIQTLTLTTLSGSTAVQTTPRSRTSTVTLDLSQLSKGLYLLQVQTPSGVVNRKVVKE